MIFEYLWRRSEYYYPDLRSTGLLYYFSKCIVKIVHIPREGAISFRYYPTQPLGKHINMSGLCVKVHWIGYVLSTSAPSRSSTR